MLPLYTDRKDFIKQLHKGHYAKAIFSSSNSWLVLTTIHANGATPTNNFKIISNDHLKSYPILRIEMDKKEEDKTLFEKITDRPRPTFRHAEMETFEQLSYIYGLFSQITDFPISSILNKVAFKDLELLCGDATPGSNIFAQIDRTILPEGKAYLANLLTTPTDIQEELHNRQEMIAFLAKNKHVAQKIEHLLTRIQKGHHAFLSLWKDEKKGEKLFIDEAFFTFPGLHYLNSIAPYQHAATTFNCVIVPGLLLYCDYLIGSKLYEKYQNETQWYKKFCEKYPDYYGEEQVSHYKKESEKSFFSYCKDGYMRVTERAGTKVHLFAAALGIVWGFIHYQMIDRVSQQISLLNYIHEKTNSAATVVEAMDKIAVIIAKNPALKNLKHKKAFITFLKRHSTLSAKMRRLIGLLRTDTFKGSVKTMSLKGRVKVAYALLREVKDEFSPALIALGEIDAYLSCAKLFKEYEKKQNKYVFATYLSQETPCIQMNGMWNPLVGSEKSIVNSINLETPSSPCNIILTGPNAGGKSTFIKGLTINVLFAQTIGIVPARSFSLTPFSAINTYMNIADDTSGGKSLFKAEVIRAQELITSIDTLPKNQFAFSAMDEVFSGTSPKEGEAASYAVAHELGSREHSILILATHFPKLKELEKATNYFKNYQVRVVRHTNGSFSYPFKLEEGAADQNVAIDILKEQGFSGSILDKANQILTQ